MNVDIPCVCGRHETDVVTLRDTLDFRAATTVRNAIGLAKIDEPDLPAAEMLAILREQYLLVGIEGWSLMNGTGPLPVTRANVRDHLLSHIDEATTVAEVADSLYTEQVVLPLLLRASASSPTTPTDASTSATSGGRTRRPKRSSPSSTSSSQTDGTGTTTPSPAGVSS